MSRHGRHRAAHGVHRARWVAVLGAVVLATGVVTTQRSADVGGVAHDGRPSVRSAADHPRPQDARPASSSPARQARAGERVRAGVPHRVVIPALDIAAPVVAISMGPDATLTPPDDPTTLGWWSQGARPGAGRGGVVVTGHTVHTGGGVFDDLEQLRPGDAIDVETGRGTSRYVVDDVAVYPKNTLAHDARRIFSQSVPERLVLVTCEGWNGVGYDDNVVVTGSPSATRP